jgi:hypothetical protein
VNFRVGGVIKLLEHNHISGIADKLLSLRNRPAHTGRSWRKDNLSAKSLEQLSPFNTHRLRHNEYQLISPDGTNKGKTYACVSAGRLDKNGMAVYPALLFSIFNHSKADSVLYAAARIEKFHLAKHIRLADI